MTNKKKRIVHTAEFKVKILTPPEKVGIGYAAKQLSLHESQVYAWRKAANKNSNTSQQKAELAAEWLETRNNLVAKSARKFKCTTDSKHKLPVAPILLEQDFTATAPNKKWAGRWIHEWQ